MDTGCACAESGPPSSYLTGVADVRQTTVSGQGHPGVTIALTLQIKPELSQNCAVVPKYLPGRRAVSAETRLLPWTISLMRRGGTPNGDGAPVRRDAEPLMTSSMRTSPG